MLHCYVSFAFNSLDNFKCHTLRVEITRSIGSFTTMSDSAAVFLSNICGLFDSKV